ncbi:MAG: class I SAM-dependent methyltransferase [Candidatus Accumulibacter sp.]|nr:class I SAM-dependent methyltransferase [Accumulibacter sp.]
MIEGPVSRRRRVGTTQPPQGLELQPDHAVVPYDENLLERARTQWQFGDWESLTKIERDILQYHPDRAKLALLAAAGHLQSDNATVAKQFIRLAQEWGCGKKLVTQILIAGVYNSLGLAAAVAGQQPRAFKHFESAIQTGTPGNDVRLLTQARAGKQLGHIGLAVVNDPLQLQKSEANKDIAAPSEPTLQKISDDVAKKIKEEIKAEVNADFKANNPTPTRTRTLTPSLNKSLREFAEKNLKREGLKPAYVDYLAAKVIQIERNCVGRLATTVQDAIARQLVTECVSGDRICILEIGALYGISLAILYNHAITRFAKAQVVCLDPFDGYYGNALDAVLNQPVNDLTFVRNMRLANVPEQDYGLIKYYSTDPAALAAAQVLTINLLIIDGDHSYEGVKYDFDSYFPLLHPGGYVIFDDYNAKEWPGVQKFIDQDLRKTQDFEYLGAISRTAVGRKAVAK